AAQQKLVNDATMKRLEQEGWKPFEDENGQYLAKVEDNQLHKIQVAGVKPKTAAQKNPGSRDRFDPKTQHMIREYFDQSDPSTVTYSADLGEASQLRNPASNTVQVQFTGPDGTAQVGTLNKGSNVVTPATIAGTGQAAQTAAAGQLGQKEVAKNFRD